MTFLLGYISALKCCSSNEVTFLDIGYEEYGTFSVDIAGEARGLPLIRPNGTVYEGEFQEKVLITKILLPDVF